MLKVFKQVSVAALTSVMAVNIAFADISIPKDQFKDPAKQFSYVYNIAHNDNPTWANYKLASYYENGYGTKKDILKAYAYYRIASGRNPEFLKALNSLKAHMSVEQIAAGDNEYDKIVSDNLTELNKSVNQTGF